MTTQSQRSPAPGAVPGPDPAPTARLRSVGLRVTAPRVAVLTELSDVGQHQHLDADTIAALVRARLGTVSTQSIYNVLAALTRTGLVRRVEPDGSRALYEIRRGDNHHHVVCHTCGVVADVGCAVGRAPCLTPSDNHGFVIERAEVVHWGLCPSCQSRTTLSSHQDN